MSSAQEVPVLYQSPFAVLEFFEEVTDLLGRADAGKEQGT
jgi:hypothetical protein